MDNALVARIEGDIAYEFERKDPPPGFPKFPDIPGGRYTDPRFWDLEQAHLWRQSWLLAGRESEVAEAGSFKVFRKLGRDILIVRGRDGLIRGFYNTCRHRGAPLTFDDRGTVSMLRCRYHSWAYGLDGTLKAVPDERDFVDLDKSCRSLLPVRVEVWGGWIFVNEDADAKPLADFLLPFASEMNCMQSDSLRLVEDWSVEVACNWKVAMDAFMEVYHLKTVHPDTVSQLLDHRGAAMGLLANGHSRMVTPYRGGALDPGQPRDAYRTGEDAFGESPDIPSITPLHRKSNVSYHLFPNFITPLGADGYPAMLFWPIDQRRTEMQVIQVGVDWGEGARPAYWDNAVTMFKAILEEDTSNLPGIQRSLDSPAFRSVPLNYQERRIYFFHETLDRAIGADNVPPDLRVEPVLAPFVELQSAAAE